MCNVYSTEQEALTESRTAVRKIRGNALKNGMVRIGPNR
jgi:hypothetical protein